MWRLIGFFIGLLLSCTAQANGELVTVNDTYKEESTHKQKQITGVGFTLIDSQNRMFVATCAHLTPSGQPRITLQQGSKEAPLKILGAVTDSEHDVAFFEIQPTSLIQPLFKIEKNLDIKLVDMNFMQLMRSEKVDFIDSRIILAPHLNDENIKISLDRYSTVNLLPEKFRKALGLSPRNYTSLDDLFSMAPIKPGFSGSPIVTASGELAGVAKSYHRFFYEYRWASPAVLRNLYGQYQWGQFKEISLAQWRMYQGITFRSIGDFWEIAPLSFPSGGISGDGGGISGDGGGISGDGGGISGDGGGISGDGGGISGDGGGISGDGGGISGDGGDGKNLNVWKHITVGSLQWQKDGSKKTILAVVGPCFNRAATCRYYPSFEVIAKIINDGAMDKYQFLTKKEVKIDSVPKLLNLKSKNKMSVQTLWTQVKLEPKRDALRIELSVLVRPYSQFGFDITPETFGPIIRIISPNKRTTYTFDVESIFYDTLDNKSQLIRFSEDGKSWEDWIQINH